MKKAFFLLSLITVQYAVGQDDFNQVKEYVGKLVRVKEVSTLKNMKFGSFETLVVTDLVERKLDFGYLHQRYLMLPVIVEELRVNMISRNDTIVHGWISEYNPRQKKHFGIQAFKNSSLFLNEYVLKHNELYKSNLTVEDFEEQMVTEYLVGFGCGFTGIDISQKTRESMRFVRKKKKRQLSRFLTSFSPELQTLGALGLFKLGKVGTEQMRIISHLKKRNSTINSCSGCIYGFGERLEQSN
ncbi:hypothetical protein DKG77_03315 [Flagellimonas aquimarina]|uniref:Uncharacterized protein n=1 Tax=Flagellimonas aquimarina TaxID=2201895 RepID=A0A316L6H1_9FLAO|nr:hypothetical protein [Allomuricauda koreensis]PWL39873.1 hypothetical protein DKG77_03315 [Allomuricauda koreensis]